jgi:hypothetical protein
MKAPAVDAEDLTRHLPRVSVTGAPVPPSDVPVADERPKDLIRDVILSDLPQFELDPAEYATAEAEPEHAE